MFQTFRATKEAMYSQSRQEKWASSEYFEYTAVGRSECKVDNRLKGVPLSVVSSGIA